MPTMREPKTGETKEISMEEFMSAMRNGQITVCQEIHRADGSVTVSPIYGNEIGDGVDRSVNIFGTLEDVISVLGERACKILDANENATKPFSMDNAGADYEVTVDNTKWPVTYVITCTKKTVKVSCYIRDERKSLGNLMQEETFSFVDGKLDATFEEVFNTDTQLYLAFAVYELRRIFAERGILQELQRLANRSSGVIVTKADDEIITIIVRGKSRPALPCMLFGGLFSGDINDAVMMRPYMDEQGYVPEEVIKHHHAKAKKSAPNKNSTPPKDDSHAKNARVEDALAISITAEYKDQLDKAKKTYEANVQNVEIRSKQLIAERNSLNEKLPTLGFFSFGEKGEIKKRLAQIEIELMPAHKEQRLAGFLEEYNNEKVALCKKYGRILAKEMESIAEKHPDAYMNAASVKRDMILLNMRPGEKYTITELLETIPLPPDTSNQQLTSLVSQLVREGELIRDVNQFNRISYFSLP